MQLNFFPINFDFEQYQVQRTPIKDGLLQNLRSEYNKTHSFFQCDGYIYISNKSGDDINLGENCTISIRNENVTKSLIKHLFFKTMRERYPKLM